MSRPIHGHSEKGHKHTKAFIHIAPSYCVAGFSRDSPRILRLLCTQARPSMSTPAQEGQSWDDPHFPDGDTEAPGDDVRRTPV